MLKAAVPSREPVNLDPCVRGVSRTGRCGGSIKAERGSTRSSSSNRGAEDRGFEPLTFRAAMGREKVAGRLRIAGTPSQPPVLIHIGESRIWQESSPISYVCSGTGIRPGSTSPGEGRRGPLQLAAVTPVLIGSALPTTGPPTEPRPHPNKGQHHLIEGRCDGRMGVPARLEEVDHRATAPVHRFRRL